jgi:hypothetical protein
VAWRPQPKGETRRSHYTGAEVEVRGSDRLQIFTKRWWVEILYSSTLELIALQVKRIMTCFVVVREYYTKDKYKHSREI